MPRPLDTLIYNGTVVTVDSAFSILKDGYIGIRDGRIVQMASRPGDIPLPAAAETVDADHGIVLPGLINAHTHLPMSLFRGLADDLPLQVWLNEHIFPAEAAHISPESVRLGTLLSCAELLLSGTTTCCDGYFLEDRVAQAVLSAGLRARLGQGVIDYPAPGVPDPRENVSHAAEFGDRWRNVDPRLQPSIFAHSPYTCSGETLKAAKRAASDRGLLFQIHVAETRHELRRIRSDTNETPVAYLDRLGLLDPYTLMVHGVWLDESDLSILSKRDVKMVHCPESNMKLGSGIAPVPQWMAHGLTVGIGTDGCASNNNLDLFKEMDMAAKLHKAHSGDPTVMDAATVLKMATIDGARAIGLESEIGSIEIGKQADLIIVDVSEPHLFPLYNPISHIVYSASGSDIRDVMVSGKFLVRNRQLTTIDIDDVMDRTNALAKEIRQILRQRPRQAGPSTTLRLGQPNN